ncbi:hypothetical protein BvCms1414_01422 [Escherichia coli]|nr:hypothetical protein BvCms1414_01422 [Escherichia coli]
MSTITREKAELKTFITAFLSDRAHDSQSANSLTANVFRLALASLEAEHVAWVWRWSDDEEGFWRYSEERKETKGSVTAKPLYTAPPAPAPVNAEPVAWLWSHRKHPSEVTLIRPEDDEKAEPGLWSGWSCQALYAEPPVAVSMTDNSAITQYFDTIALETAREIMCDVNRRHEFLGGEVQLLSRIQCRIDDACRAAMLQGAEHVTTACKLPEETGSSLQLRNLIRQRHTEWSQATFGDVGPVGPLKHLSKEALEAAAEPEDLSEWADMQFLLWDAQRRAGISDGEITAAMEEKLKVNMARQWPEPKDGEPRLHIKAAPQQEVKP